MTFPALLQEKSENVIKVVKEGAQNVIRIIRFSTNTTQVPELKIAFKSNCGKLQEMKTDSFCDNVEEGKRYTFEVSLELIKQLENGQDVTKTIWIEEQNIQEKIRIDLEYVGQTCSCKNDDSTESSLSACNGHGQYRCGTCYCYEGWTGSNCAEECGKVNDQEACRESEESFTSPVCYLKYFYLSYVFTSAKYLCFSGNCECGKCKCDPGYVGKYCRYSCPL